MEKLFWAFLFVNPFLDILNGVYISLVMEIGALDIGGINTLGITPSLLVRMLMLVVFACYVLLLRDKKSPLCACGIGAALAASIVSEYLSTGSAQLFLDVQYAARYGYNLVLLMVYTHVFARRWEAGKPLLTRLDDIVCFTLILYSLAVLIPAVIGIGYSTYADRFGYRGSRGFFYAGNDLTAVLAVLLPVSAARLIQMDRTRAGAVRTLLYALAGGLGVNTLVIVGSKTAFIAVAVTVAVMLVMALLSPRRGEGKHIWAGFGLFAAASLLIFAVLLLISGADLLLSIDESFNATSKVLDAETVESAVLSGRQVKFMEHFTAFKAGGPLVWLFGLGRGSQSVIVEMDVFEVFFYYGILGAVAFLWLYVKAAVDFLKCFFARRTDRMAIGLFVALGLCAGYLVLAGHVLFSVTSGFYFLFVIVYSRVYFAAEPQDILLWRAKAN